MLQAPGKAHAAPGAQAQRVVRPLAGEGQARAAAEAEILAASGHKGADGLKPCGPEPERPAARPAARSDEQAGLARQRSLGYLIGS